MNQIVGNICYRVSHAGEQEWELDVSFQSREEVEAVLEEMAEAMECGCCTPSFHTACTSAYGRWTENGVFGVEWFAILNAGDPAAITECTATITGRGEDSQVPDRPDAVDAEIAIGHDRYDVTLLQDATGALDTWGSLENWAGADLAERLDAINRDDRRESINVIVQAVRDAAEAGK